jgi:hypothetical protein
MRPALASGTANVSGRLHISLTCNGLSPGAAAPSATCLRAYTHRQAALQTVRRQIRPMPVVLRRRLVSAGELGARCKMWVSPRARLARWSPAHCAPAKVGSVGDAGLLVYVCRPARQAHTR